ncbi:MAG: DUF2336 domain-containing protein [Alphaproteobacteria bacterium]|nr:DUF2336 domain-containing protein [Alphaproteobacteria bacterium]MBF0251185.1 DUF2336 domain-containing protein [Alphaproteobacteria bacterium]
MLKGMLERFRRSRDIAYEEAKKQAKSDDDQVRLSLARHPRAQPEILYFLAEDRNPGVRAAIAENPATPRHADLMLVGDADVEVRSKLAGKISALAPGLTANEVDQIRRMTYEALEALARDQATKVRRIVAETLQEMADAPAEVIRHLAEDTELVVCAPVLENSPVLTERDLIQIIALNPVDGAISAISRRSSLPDEVMEEIFASNDTQAVAELLENGSVAIKENLLERICERSRAVKSWQSPLVHRPKLPKGVALRLADFVAEHLIQALLKRKDLDPGVIEAVREEVSWRLDAVAEDEAAAEDETALERARRVHGEGKLIPDSVLAALRAGEREYAIAALSVLAQLPITTVEAIAQANHSKGMVALAWKAGLDSDGSVLLQKRLGKIPPSSVIHPQGGTYGLSRDEMEWHLEFFGK